MEKFSAYRDPGTGIQPFLTPVPTAEVDLLAKLTLPLQFLVGILRVCAVSCIFVIYSFLAPFLCAIFAPVPPIRRGISKLLTAFLTRTVLFILGFFWISPEEVGRKKGKLHIKNQQWRPQAGDVIVSNWVSWLELLWLAFRFDPIFVVPIIDEIPPPITSSGNSTILRTPGRRAGTGSTSVQSPRKAVTSAVPVVGFRRVSLLTMIQLTGQVPSILPKSSASPSITIEGLRKDADRPIVVFPECTTSNGRGLLRFAKIFSHNLPMKYQIFIMCVRYDPPTAFASTLTHSIPSSSLNPLSHLFSIASSLSLPAISIRLLNPAESPSSPTFAVNDILANMTENEDQLDEICSIIIAQIGKMKRTGMGWEDKANFLNFYKAKQK